MSGKTTDWRTFGILIGLMVPIGFFWNTWAVYPLKILVVFFHEMSHGFAAVITGGSILRIKVVAEQGGLCVTRGGSRFVTLTAGYLGSLIWGGSILVLAARTRWDKAIAVVLGVTMIIVAVVWVRPLGSFGFFFGLGSGAVLGGAGLFLPESVNDYLLRLIGLASCLYAVLDIKSDILDRPEVRSDAFMLGELTGMPTLFWGVLWIVIAGAAALFFLFVACRTAGQSTESSK